MIWAIAQLNPEFWCPGWLLGAWSVIRNTRVSLLFDFLVTLTTYPILKGMTTKNVRDVVDIPFTLAQGSLAFWATPIPPLQGPCQPAEMAQPPCPARRKPWGRENRNTFTPAKREFLDNVTLSYDALFRKLGAIYNRKHRHRTEKIIMCKLR